MKNYLIVFALAGAVTPAFAQDYETVNSKELTGTADKSYIVNQYGVLKAPFTHNASSQGTFFLRANSTGENEASPGKNFVKTVIPLVGVSTEGAVIALPISQKVTSYEYSDGVGRTVQQVQVRSSPAGMDVVTYNTYDEFGRAIQSRLPFVAAQQNGAFRNPASLDSEQSQFYGSGVGIPTDSRPYGLNVYEDSPLNRIQKTYGPGQVLHPDVGSDKPVVTNTRSNLTDEVRIWIDNGASPPTTSIFFPAGALVAQETTSEQGIVTVRYVNFRGQLILTKTGSGSNWHEIYYVYDAAGNSRFVFPPEASARVASEYVQAGTDKQAFLDRWCFQYKYDGKLRLIEKRVPGAGWVYIIYDKWDRVVFTQDANQRLSNQWLFNKYDAYNRPVITGMTTGSRASLETSAAGASVRYESRTNNSIGYSNNAIPSASAGDILTITYYDDHLFTSYSSWHPVGKSYGFVNESGFPQEANVLTGSTVGKVTGSKIKIPGPNTWLNSVEYYDNLYRRVQSISDNHLGGQDRLTNSHDPLGRVVMSRHVHSGSASVAILKEVEYDNSGRVLRKFHTIDGGPRVLTHENKYNEAGHLIETNIHSVNGSPFLQSIDYRYNIRGHLTSINNSGLSNDGALNDDATDLFGLELKFTDAPQIGGATSSARYDGSVASILWGSNNLVDAPIKNGIGIHYDDFGRIASTNYGVNVGSVFSGNANGFTESLSYDRNGNIRSLNRNFVLGGTITQIDQLAYRYGTNSPAFDNAGNRLTSVDDGAYWDATQGNPDFGFTELTKQVNLGTNEYEYDENGNLKVDYNKGITGSSGVSYSHLNKPLMVPIQNVGDISFTYDAVGNKIKKVASAGSSSAEVDYVGDVHYVGGQLSFISTEGGRAVKNGSTYDYEYFIRDNVGSTRVVFGSQKETFNYRASMEPERNTRELADFQNLVRTSGPNKTSKSWETPNPLYSAALNGTVGPARMLNVSRLDRVNLEAHGRYSGSVSGSTVANTAMAVAVATAFGPTLSELGYSTMTGSGGLPNSLGALSPSSGAPKAFVGYCLFSSDFGWSQIGFQVVSTAASVAFEKLNFQITVPNNMPTATGYMYVFVANQTSGTTVNFDEFAITHERNSNALQVLQVNDYSVFGLGLSPLGYKKQTLNAAEPPNQTMYQGKENVSQLGLDWDDFSARQYDREIGRFVGVDAMSEALQGYGPYTFALNNPAAYVDIDGNYPFPSWNYSLEYAMGQASQGFERSLYRNGPDFALHQAIVDRYWGPVVEDYNRNLTHWAGKPPVPDSPDKVLGQMIESAESPYAKMALYVTFKTLGALGELTPFVAIPRAIDQGRKGNYGEAALTASGAVAEIATVAARIASVSRAATATNSASQGWRVGNPIDNLTSRGNVPSWSTVRQRYWKNQAHYAESGEYSETNMARMKKGLAAQHFNPLTGQMESMELHHHVVPQRFGGLFEFVPLTPEQHRLADPFRY